MIYAVKSAVVDMIRNVATADVDRLGFAEIYLDHWDTRTFATINTPYIDTFSLTEIAINGTCRTMILMALLSTMLPPDVQWTAQEAEISMEQGSGSEEDH